LLASQDEDSSLGIDKFAQSSMQMALLAEKNSRSMSVKQPRNNEKGAISTRLNQVI